MNQSGICYIDILKGLSVELLLLCTALVVLFVDLFQKPIPFQLRVKGTLRVATVGLLGAILVALVDSRHIYLARGLLVIEPVTQLLKAFIIALGLVALSYLFCERETDHVGELVALLVLSLLGLCYMVSTEHMLGLFLGLETASLAFYGTTALAGQTRRHALEAALKYLFYGSVASAFFLYGVSIIYGLFGTLEFCKLAAVVKDNRLEPTAIVATVMILIALGFKIAAVPFHLWAPDTYQAAPVAVVGVVGTGSKIAALYLLAKLLLVPLGWARGAADSQFLAGWKVVVWIMAMASILLGNLAAIVQYNIRRLLAYSAIAHAGYALVAFLSPDHAVQNKQIIQLVLFYAITYSASVIGMFGIVAIQVGRGREETVEQLRGLSLYNPIIAIFAMVFLLSLAGVPPLAGFAAKFFIFCTIIGHGLISDLTIGIAIAFSAVGLYYYLRVLKQIWVLEPQNGLPSQRSRVSPAVLFWLASSALFVLLAGLYPEAILRWLAP